MIEFKGEVSREVIDYVKSLKKYSVKEVLAFFLIIEACGMCLGAWMFLSEGISKVQIAIIEVVLLLIFIVMNVIGIYLHLHPSDYETNRQVAKRLYIDYEDRALYYETKELSINMVGLEKVKKVIDYGNFYQICIGKESEWCKYICQKDLLVKGSIKEFERIFKRKLVRADGIESNHENDPKQPLQLEKEDEPQIIETTVIITGMRCGIKKSGYRTPKTEKGYFVTVTTSDGKKGEYRVEEEFYSSVAEGQTVTMLTRGKYFYGFVID